MTLPDSRSHRLAMTVALFCSTAFSSTLARISFTPIWLIAPHGPPRTARDRAIHFAESSRRPRLSRLARPDEMPAAVCRLMPCSWRQPAICYEAQDQCRRGAFFCVIMPDFSVSSLARRKMLAGDRRDCKRVGRRVALPVSEWSMLARAGDYRAPSISRPPTLTRSPSSIVAAGYQACRVAYSPIVGATPATRSTVICPPVRVSARSLNRFI